MARICGAPLADISLPQLVTTWMLLVDPPGLLLRAAPLLVSVWIRAIVYDLANLFHELAPVLLLTLWLS